VRRRLRPETGDGYLEHRNQVPPPRLCFNSGRHERFASVPEQDNFTGFEVRRRMLEEAEVVAGRVVEAVRRHGSNHARSSHRPVVGSQCTRSGPRERNRRAKDLDVEGIGG
jgi:hypothetical protein